MLRTFGLSMFFGAAGMHVACLWLLSRPAVRAHFLAAPAQPPGTTTRATDA